ncbi:disease resistance protein RGA2-like [Carex rostrata]
MVSLLHPFINMVVQKSSEAVIKQCTLMIGVNEEREKLHLKLLTIENMLVDADERSGTGQGKSMKAWLAKLKKVAYEADDVLDDFQYEAIKKEVEVEMPGYAITKSVRNFFSTSNPTLFRYTMGKRLKDVLQKIDEVVRDMREFGIKEHQVSPYTEQPQTTSVVDESEIVGREEDVHQLVKTLIDDYNGENVRVISIVGMGGLGKTTLAQLIYNNQDVKMFFALRFWVSVSNDFSVDKIAKCMIDYHTREYSNLQGDNMELLQFHLKKIIGLQRYLLVLDDVWSVDPSKWEKLENMLRCSSVGSVVIVTSRIETVASTTRPVRHNLEHLNEHNSWTIFQRRAFGSGVEESAVLVKIGKEIVKKCGGVPLAIKSLGMLLSEKYREREWQAVLHSKSWEKGFEDADDVWHKQILNALRVSYDHLPPHVKQCFVFCVVFPKGYVMDKEMLIQLWIANGFIQCEGNMEPEVKGEAVFNVLKRRYFLQPEKFNYWKEFRYHGKLTFKMHDLIHDLALSLINNENLTLSRWRDSTKSSTHLNHFLLENSTSLRSFLSLKNSSVWQNNPLLKRQRVQLSLPSTLRALEFHVYPNLTFPKMPTNMKHIRYLDLSWSMVTELPEEMSTLYHLQTLKLSHSEDLVKLPAGMRYMRSLRHIYINSCDKLKRLPPGLGQLKRLRTLTNYIVGNDAGCQITELQDLDLHGKLEIYNLREVKRASDAAKANIFSKKNLDKLLLSWPLPRDMDWEADNSKDVLNALKPHKGLKVFDIVQYGGVEFPDWMRDHEMFQSLVELSFDGCRRCKNLPQVGLLPELKFLKLCNLHELTHICDDGTLQLEGDTISHQFFPKLKTVVLRNLNSLEGWHANENFKLEMPQVVLMEIFNCPKLKGMPITPKWMEIGENRDFQKWLWVQAALQDNYPVAWKFRDEVSFQHFQSVDLTKDFMHSNVIRKMYMNLCHFFIQSETSRFHISFWRSFTCLAWLEIHNCDTLVAWPEMEFENLNCLKYLGIHFCKKFTGEPQKLVPPSLSRKETLLVLEELYIHKCPKLQEFPTNFKFLKRLAITCSPQFLFFPVGFETLTSLESLDIGLCENLQSLPQTLGDLTRLRELFIESCLAMNSLPSGMEKLTALKQVTIKKCPKIDSFPDGLQQRISQLEMLEIFDCPDLVRRCKKGEYLHLVSEIPKKCIQEKQGFTCNFIKDRGLALGISIKKTFSPCGSTRQLNTTLRDMSYWTQENLDLPEDGVVVHHQELLRQIIGEIPNDY